MTERYPKNKTMHKVGQRENFCFASREEYEDKLKEGWVFNPADLNKLSEKVEEVKTEEEVPQPFIHRPSVPGTPDIEPIDPLQCKLCDFKGKNEQSLKMHKFHKHKDK